VVPVIELGMVGLPGGWQGLSGRGTVVPVTELYNFVRVDYKLKQRRGGGGWASENCRCSVKLCLANRLEIDKHRCFLY
jgi:hypothetical protein